MIDKFTDWISIRSTNWENIGIRYETWCGTNNDECQIPEMNGRFVTLDLIGKTSIGRIQVYENGFAICDYAGPNTLKDTFLKVTGIRKYKTNYFIKLSNHDDLDTRFKSVLSRFY